MFGSDDVFEEQLELCSCDCFSNFLCSNAFTRSIPCSSIFSISVVGCHFDWICSPNFFDRFSICHGKESSCLGFSIRVFSALLYVACSRLRSLMVDNAFKSFGFLFGKLDFVSLCLIPPSSFIFTTWSFYGVLRVFGLTRLFFSTHIYKMERKCGRKNT